MAERSGLSKSTIGRIWRAFDLKPHRADGFKVSNDPLFVEKVYDVVGLYLNPPEAAVVLCVDEKSQVQALARSQPAFGDDARHAGGAHPRLRAARHDQPVRRVQHRRRHRDLQPAPPAPRGGVQEFLNKIDSQVPEHLYVHLVCDNYGTHKTPTVKAWLDRHPRFHMHYTPTYSSWINQVERFFGLVTADLLQRSDHRSVQALEADIRAWVKAWNDNPKPFIWTKSAEQILTSLQRLLQRTTGAGH